MRNKPHHIIIYLATLGFMLSSCAYESTNTLYDDFNPQRDDKSYNFSKWVVNQEENGSFQQRDGLIIVKSSGKVNSGISLRTINFSSKIDKPMFFEGKLMINMGQTGHVYLFLEGLNGYKHVVGTDCTLGYGDQAKCNFDMYGENEYKTETFSAVPATWHTYRIEVYPEQMMFKYYLDGINIGSYIPKTQDPIKNAIFHIEIGYYQAGDEGLILTGYFDEVSLGNIK
jgi:hypothetical protein